jgi:serine/threonine protein kinase
VADDKKTQLGQAPLGPTAPGTPPPPAAKTSYLPQSDDPLIGTTLAGRYAIQKKLGEGGMGAVYLATHNILEKQVALKVLHGEFARKPDLVERFMQEAKAASRIRNENVIDISDFGATPEGLVFFAMELLTGHDLHDEITRARVTGHLLPWSRTKKIFLQICGALSAAHAKGIVHRDLKPENVYLVEFLGDPDFVKLLDFGIAKLTEAEGGGGGERKLTKTGMLFGTPEYMSPEQARGEQVDHRVDIYAMGCILFQLVTNRVPFEADNFMGVLSMHLTEPPPSIAPEVFDQIGAPRALAHVIDRALIKDRNARYQTIDELANAVREVCGDPLPAGPTGRAPSVPSPATTTTRRAPSGASPTIGASVPQPLPSGERGAEATGRIKTQWTGNLTVPETTDEVKQSRSKLPLVLGALLVVGGGAVAAVLATRGSSDTKPLEAAGSGSAIASGVATAGSVGSAIAPPPPPPPPPKLPDMVRISLDSTPHGATVIDMKTGKPLPSKTPTSTSIPGEHGTREFVFHLRGYADVAVELPLDRSDSITHTEPLVKGPGGGAPVVHQITDANLKPLPTGTGSAAVVTHPDTGSGAVTHPDTGSGAVTHPDTGSAAPQPKPCSEEDDITDPRCLKGIGSGQH